MQQNKLRYATRVVSLISLFGNKIKTVKFYFKFLYLPVLYPCKNEAAVLTYFIYLNPIFSI